MAQGYQGTHQRPGFDTKGDHSAGQRFHGSVCLWQSWILYGNGHGGTTNIWRPHRTPKEHFFQSGETVSEIISDFYGHTEKKNESEDVFADDLQILGWKIFAQETSFRANASKQLNHQYAHKLWDLYYAAIAHGVLQISNNMESFTQFCGHLAMTLRVEISWKKLAPTCQLWRSPHMWSLRSQGSQN